jgi:hypothetical protein
LGLPGETLESHITGINQLIDAGTHEMHLFQAMMLKGSELETAESRQKYKFDSRFRVLPKNYGIYADEKVFDVDEIVVGTDTMSFEDYLEARRFALAFSIFWNNSWFEDAANLAASFGVKPSEWMASVRDRLSADQGEIGRLVAEFITETQNELFPTREACVEFYSQPENFERLVAGEIGDNLMYKYRVIASFFMWPEICALALDTTRVLLEARGADAEIEDFDHLWRDFHLYVECKHTHGSTSEQMLAPYRATLRYDIESWIASGMPKDARHFRLDGPQPFLFDLTPDAATELDHLTQVWTTSLRGLTKGITRMRTTSLIRRCRPVAEDSGISERAAPAA